MNAADDLFEALESGTPIPPLTETQPGITVDEAYAIQRDLLARHAAAGRVIVGRKIGLTSLAMQQQLGIDSPDFGAILDAFRYASGATVPCAPMIAPRLEPELAFVLSETLAGPGVTLEQVRAATAEVVPVMEIIDSRVRDWKIKLPDTVADNASCYGAVVGAGKSLAEAGEPAAIAVAMSRDGEVLQRGTGDAVMGDPFLAVQWLANELGRHGDALEAGHLVLAGSFTAAVEATPGEYVADFGALGRVSVVIA